MYTLLYCLYLISIDVAWPSLDSQSLKKLRPEISPLLWDFYRAELWGKKIRSHLVAELQAVSHLKNMTNLKLPNHISNRIYSRPPFFGDFQGNIYLPF